MGDFQTQNSDLCSEGRMLRAVRIGFYWVVPQDAEKPLDARIKSGKYVKMNDRVVG